MAGTASDLEAFLVFICLKMWLTKRWRKIALMFLLLEEMEDRTPFRVDWPFVWLMCYRKTSAFVRDGIDRLVKLFATALATDQNTRMFLSFLESSQAFFVIPWLCGSSFWSIVVSQGFLALMKALWLLAIELASPSRYDLFFAAIAYLRHLLKQVVISFSVLYNPP